MDWFSLHNMHVSNATVFTSLLKEENSAQIQNRWQQMDQQHTEREKEYLQER